MRNSPLKSGFTIAVLCVSSQLAAESAEALQAGEDLRSAQTCHVSGLRPMRKLIKRYKNSSDLDTQIVVAKARYDEAFTYWFDSDPKADLLLKRIIKRYEWAGNPKLEAIAADARITLVMTKRSPKQIRRYVTPIITRYHDADDPDLARSYSRALFALSGVERAAGHRAEAQRLYDAAAKVSTLRINSDRPALAPDPDGGSICVTAR